MEVNEKIKHLSEKQIEEVIAMYQDKSIKISDILVKYKIDVRPSSLLKVLPPMRTEMICPICGEYLYQNIEARTTYTYSSDERDKFCLCCNHYEYANTRWRKRVCNCEGCKEKIKLAEEKKKNLIRNTYGGERKKVEFADLELEDQIRLVYLLFNNTYHNTSQIAPMDANDDWIVNLNRMVEIGAISVSPQSEMEAFCEEDFPNRYYVSKVIYDVNVVFDDDTLSKINKNEFFIECGNEEKLVEIYKEYIYCDLIEKFEDMLETRRLQLHISQNANDSFCQLIDKISYTQILALCNRVAVFFSDKVLIGDMSKSVAKNAALSNVSKFYERAVASDWSLIHADIDYVNKKLEFFITRVLNKDISILKDVASVENVKKWEKRDVDYSRRIGRSTD